MAKSQYEYVKTFERDEIALPQTWIMCRIDGHAFTKFTAAHSFIKPNDSRARDLMNAAAKTVLTEYTDICLGYGVSDEYSFILHPNSMMYNRRMSKIASSIVSLFTSSYVASWSQFFPSSPLQLNNLPYFDSRCVIYPSDAIIRDYLSWRQVDCHINNLYNTCFWLLVREYEKRKGEDGKAWTEKQARDEAHKEMNSIYASSAAKNELLHSRFGLNYNDQPAADRKGSIIIWQEAPSPTTAVTAVASAEAAATLASSSSSSSTGPSDPSSSSAAVSALTPSSVATPSANTDLSASLLVPVTSTSSSSTSSSSAAAASSSPHPYSVSPKRQLIILHCDMIQREFFDLHPGIIPYESWSDQQKAKRGKEKEEKKKEHKRKEKEEKEKMSLKS